MRIFIYIFILSSQSFALDIFKRWESLQDDLANVGVTRNACIDREEIDQTTIQQCALDLCGAPKDNLSAFIKDFNYQQFIDESELESFEPYLEKVKEITQLVVDRNKKFVDQVKEKYPEGLKANFEEWKKDDFLSFSMGIASSLVPEVDLSKPLGQRLEIKVPKIKKPA